MASSVSSCSPIAPPPRCTPVRLAALVVVVSNTNKLMVQVCGARNGTLGVGGNVTTAGGRSEGSA